MRLKFTFLIFFLPLLCFSQKNIKKPNVLLLYMDDLRPELKSYGATHINSPNIDMLSKKYVFQICSLKLFMLFVVIFHYFQKNTT